MKLSKRVNLIVSNDIFQTSLWIGASAAIMAIVAFLLDKPEMAQYYGILNFVAYAIKSINDKRK